MRGLSLLLALLLGCGAPVVSAPCLTMPSVTPEPLPAPVETTAELPKKTGEPTALEAGSPAPFTGVLLDTYLVGKYKVVLAERDRLRSQLLIEREARAQVQGYYQLVLRDTQQRATRSWWEKNQGLLGLAAGVVLTTTLALGLTYGLRTVGN